MDLSRDDTDNNNNNKTDALNEDGNPIDENDDNDDDEDDFMEDAAKSDDLSMTDEDDDDNNNDKAVSPEQVDILLLKAAGLKEEGNQEFKDGDLDKAARAYRRGVNALKKLNQNNSGDDQVKALLVTLHTNLSTVSFKNSKYRVSVDVASHALKIDSSNVKALFRRAVAHRKLGNSEEARTDLRTALAVDANNVSCKRELASVKKELEMTKESQKRALSKAFSSDSSSRSSFLYNDMQDAAKRKAEQEELQRLLDVEQKEQHKVQWEDDCVARMSTGKDAISFDKWDQERIEREAAIAKEKEEAEIQRKKESKKAAAKAKAANETNSNSSTNDDDDDDELTEAELAMMRGYKKTADGRTTSYFTRELSADEKTRLGDIAPKRLDTNNNSAIHDRSGSVTPVRMAATASHSSDMAATASSSAWNQAGTWEEKDTTEWCKSQLQQRLEETTTPVIHNANDKDCEVVVTSVEELTGDASVAYVSGKKRYIFDFHVKLKYEIKRADDQTVVASGVVRLPDICSTHHEELEVLFENWTTKPRQDSLEQAMAARNSLADHLRTSVVQSFVQDFNDAY